MEGYNHVGIASGNLVNETFGENCVLQFDKLHKWKKTNLVNQFLVFGQL